MTMELLDEEELRRILDEGSATPTQGDELAMLRADLARQGESMTPSMGEAMPKGTKVVFAEETQAPVTPQSAAARMPTVPKVVDVSNQPTDDMEMAYARAQDRKAKSREAFERGTRELIAGLTRTQVAPTFRQDTDAVAKLLAKRKERDAANERTNAQRLNAAKFDYDQKSDAEKKAETKAKDERDFTYQQKIDAERLDAQRENSAATRALAGAQFGATQKNRASEDLSSLRKEFNALPAVKQYGEVSSAYEKVKAAASNPSAAGDLSAIFAYMKMLDPGSSVREGEFANAQNAGGIDAKIQAAYNNLLKGERLTPEQRADFINQAERLYSVHRSQYEEQAKRYRTLAERQGAAPDDVVAPLGGGARVGSVSAVDTPTPETIYVNDAGERIRWDGKAWVPVK